MFPKVEAKQRPGDAKHPHEEAKQAQDTDPLPANHQAGIPPRG